MQPWPTRPVPVFPLPNVVLFPLVAIPLHVFELRYRTMVRDSLSAGRHIALAVLKPGWERDYHGSPEFHPLVCFGSIAEVEWLPNDCYDLRVRGLARARVSRIAREYPYRAAKLEPCPQHPYPEDDPLVRIERDAVMDAARRMARALSSELAPPDGLGLEATVNLACTFAPMDPQAKLALLEEDSVLERGRRIREWIEAWLQAGGAGPGREAGGARN